MKNKIIIPIILLIGCLIVIGCTAKNKKVTEEIVDIFNINDFKTGIMDNYESKSELNLESQYGIGFMYAESFSTDESGTLNKGVIQVSGRAFDPADFGDESVPNGRIYSSTINKSGSMNLKLSNGSVVDNFYQRYYDPLNIDKGLFEYKNIDEDKASIKYESTFMNKGTENGKAIFIHEYKFYYFEGSKIDNKISNGELKTIKIKSYVDISAEMESFIKTEFGKKFIVADTFNQTLGNNFLKGIFFLEEFIVDYN